MKIQINRTLYTIALILLLTISAMMATMPAVNAHTPAWTIKTYSYITAAPNPVGVNEHTTLAFWVNWVPIGAGGTGGDRWRNLQIQVTKPDGTKETLGPYVSDPIGGSYATYTPNQVGTYTFLFSFPGQVASMYGPTGLISVNPSNWDYINDTFLPSTATTTITVQQQSVSQLSYPLPTEYWTRPIEGQNTAWASLASNWLGSPQIIGNVQPDGAAPASPHVMWTKPIQFGGVVGGTNTYINGATFYDGTAYEGRFTGPLILYGRLYYNLPRSDANTGGGYACVDLRTGETLYWQNMTAPTFGQLYYYEALNQHGVIPNGYLWRTVGTNWTAYDPLNGNDVFTLTDVPAGTSMYGSDGAIVRYVLNYNTAKKSGWLGLWNNTAEQQGLHGGLGYSTNAYQWRPVGKVVNMSNAYSWNVTIAADLSGQSAPAIVRIIPDDMILGRSTTFSGIGVWGTPDPWTMWAISLKPATRGQLLWLKNYPAPSGNQTLTTMSVDPDTRVFTMFYRDSLKWEAYSIDNGQLLWTSQQPEDPWAFYAHTSLVSDGKLFSSGYGVVYCYDLKTGKLLWNYSVSSGLESPYPNYPLSVDTIADGKVYIGIIEHSAGSPYWKGAMEHCLNETTGEVLWTLPMHGASTAGGLGAITTGFALADGYFVTLNLYDMQIYSIGKGPSATTVTVSPKSSTQGTKILLEGTVTDIAAGTKQDEQAARFPSGVPAVSDKSMSDWMAYVYMQKPKPTDVTGVKVHLTGTDPNGNFQDIGTATSNSLGNFALQWKPPVPGLYTVTAAFEGSESYYPSVAGTSFVVSETTAAPAVVITASPAVATPTNPATNPPTSPTVTVAPTPSPVVIPPTSAAPTTTYIAIGVAVIVIIAVAAALTLRKRK
jgi:outer membrane protein assembly factor BamB